MVEYKLNLNTFDGMPSSVQKFEDGVAIASIPLSAGNADFCRFLIWNKRNGNPITLPESLMATIDMDLIEQCYGRDV